MSEEVRTARLLLRRWTEADLVPFAALNADPAVMEHFPAPLDRAASDALVARFEAGFAAHGFGTWAVEVDGALAGCAGLSAVPERLGLGPAVEVGWRFATWAWGRGYATEAARAAVLHGREHGVGEVVSFTATTNLRSQRVMQRLGMQHDPAGDFDHPALPEGHRLRRHVLYRLPADRAPSG